MQNKSIKTKAPGQKAMNKTLFLKTKFSTIYLCVKMAKTGYKIRNIIILTLYLPCLTLT